MLLSPCIFNHEESIRVLLGIADPNFIIFMISFVEIDMGLINTILQSDQTIILQTVACTPIILHLQIELESSLV
jgi:hypothetical protein